MKPPYDPAHVEQVVFPRSKTSHVLARCSCGWASEEHDLSLGGAARLLATDLNGHRSDYVKAGAA